jgi:hypothetical protein
MLGVEHWTCVDGCSVREPFNLLISLYMVMVRTPIVLLHIFHARRRLRYMRGFHNTFTSYRRSIVAARPLDAMRIPIHLKPLF